MDSQQLISPLFFSMTSDTQVTDLDSIAGAVGAAELYGKMQNIYKLL